MQNLGGTTMKTLIKLSLFVFFISACGPLTQVPPEVQLEVATFEYQDFAYNLTFSPDEKLIAMTTLRGLYVYDIKTAKELAAFEKPGGSAIIFSKKYLAAITNEGLFVWDLKDYKLLFEHAAEQPVTFQSIAIAPDDSVIVTGEAGQMRVWSLPGGKLLNTIDVSEVGGGSFISDIVFKDNNRIIVADTYFGVIQEWDIQTQKKLKVVSIEEPVIRFHLSKDAKLAIVDYGNTGFELWNVDTGKIQHGYGDIVSASGWQGFSGNGQYVVVWGYSFDSTTSGMSVWDLKAHTNLQEFKTSFVNGDGWRCGTLNSDGSILAASNNEGYIYFYDTKSGEKLGEIFLPYTFKG
jgi:WD40 repeat protein